MKHGEGRIDNSKGTWYYVKRINGKYKWYNLQLKGTKSNERQAEKLAREILKNIQNNRLASDMSFVDYLNYWIKTKENVIKPSTYEAYTIALNSKVMPYFKQQNYKMCELKEKHFTEFYKYLKLYGHKNGSGLSRKSVKNIKGILTKALDDAIKEDLIFNNFALSCDFPTFENDIKEDDVIFNAEEITALLKLMKEKYHYLYIPLLLLAHTGIRRGELLTITWNDVNFEKNTIYVNKSRTGTTGKVSKLTTTPKSETSTRQIPLTGIVLETLKSEYECRITMANFLKENVGDVLNSPIVLNSLGMPWKSPNGIDKIYKKVLERHGFRYCTLHGIRKSVATLLHENDVSVNEISKLLGHAHVSTTEKNYIKKSRKVRTETTDKLASLYEKST